MDYPSRKSIGDVAFSNNGHLLASVASESGLISSWKQGGRHAAETVILYKLF
jgi:hypothetical protein